MANLDQILETALYVDDLERAGGFYARVLGLRRLLSEARDLQAFAVGERSVLLLFRRGARREPTQLKQRTIPPHDGQGPVHIAFAVAADALAAWEERLGEHGVPIESRTEWPRGGRSVYFRDPDGHLLELATPGIWEIY
jgi:catechol 2,3-dioxygenase-like lactoylglutathione lyase family enzyme